MGELNSGSDLANVNVMLEPKGPPFSDWQLPCPVCGLALSIRLTKNEKPYCVCDECGMQLFIRGKRGIARLLRAAKSGVFVFVGEDSASRGIAFFNRLERLELQKSHLEGKRKIFSLNPELENAIRIVDSEIESVQRELSNLAGRNEKATTT